MQQNHGQITQDIQLLRQIDECAASQGLTTESWLRRQLRLQTQTASAQTVDDDETMLLHMVQRHFQDMGLGASARQQLAEAMFDTIENGDPHNVDQLGPMQRSYQLRRRCGALSIRVGQGRVQLSLPYALRLAIAIDPDADHRDTASEAA